MTDTLKMTDKYTSFCHDFCAYFLAKPKIKTLIRYISEEEKENYSQRILQRINIEVTEYSVLNIHRIGINVPIQYIFDELMLWDGKSEYWPNQLAQIKRINDQLENIYIYLFGIEKIKLPWFKSIEIKITPLFHLSAIKFQSTSSSSEPDNARYLLYKCSGGYPIGIFSLYIRSSINENKETESAQLFSLVAFNFYGRKNIFYTYILNPIWEKIHNRVTTNILNRIKLKFEEGFEESILAKQVK